MSQQTSDEEASRRWGWSTWITIALSVVFVFTLVRVCSPHEGYVDRGFDAGIWRDDPQQRPAMADDLIDHLKDRDYTRKELVAMLGESSNRRADKLTWTIGECGWGMPVYCYLNVEFTPDGRIARVYETRD